MVNDLVLDTHVLASVIAQYFKNNIASDGLFVEGDFISKPVAFKLNQINTNFEIEEDFRFGVVVTSIFSLVEIIRKFSIISENRFSLLQFRAFLEETPPWIQVEPLSLDLYKYFYYVPRYVTIDDNAKPIEWPDAVHCATYLSRDNALLATKDSRIHNIPNIKVMA